MLILGIDPGTAVTGFGVVRADPRPTLVECGVIRTAPTQPLPERLRDIAEGVRELLAR
ncbi:MAG: Holliday junction endonuclease RuvC, partial [Gemmatimonadota bacterium]